MEKLFNGNLRSTIDLLEATKENLDTLWNGGETRLQAGELKGITDALTSLEEKTKEIKVVVDLFEGIALKKS